MLSTFTTISKLILIVYFSACAYLYIAQDDLLFKPDAALNSKKDSFADSTEYFITVSDNISLQAWFRTPVDSHDITIVMLHGNAGNLSTRKRHIDNFRDPKRGFLIFSWRGYGNNSGKPSEAGLYADAKAVLDWLNQKGIPDSQIILYGESLGSGVAVEMATQRQLKGLILGAPYTSITEMAKRDYPWMPIDLLLKHPFDSLSKIPDISEPLAILHSRDDPVIPFELGQKLAKHANEPIAFYRITDRGHTGFNKTDLDTALAWILEQ
jgi:fermentation-respiration switch protein FrsA (DUF1100 family)